MMWRVGCYEKAQSVDNFPLWRKRNTNDCLSHDTNTYVWNDYIKLELPA